MEGVAAGPIGRWKGDVHARRRLAVDEEEERTAIAEADGAGPVEHHGQPERREGCLVERAAAIEIRHADRDMVKHMRLLGRRPLQEETALQIVLLPVSAGDIIEA